MSTVVCMVMDPKECARRTGLSVCAALGCRRYQLYTPNASASAASQEYTPTIKPATCSITSSDNSAKTARGNTTADATPDATGKTKEPT